MNKISEAICFATEAFDGISRKAENYPAIFHCIEAANIAQTICNDTDTVCAAILHDTVEDTNVTIEQIRDKFGDRIAFLVSSETEKQYPLMDPKDSWIIRKEESLKLLKECNDISVKAMWIGDKLSNMRSFYRLKQKYGLSMWEKFNQQDPKIHENYYRNILSALTEFEGTAVYNELKTLVNKVFEENING